MGKKKSASKWNRAHFFKRQKSSKKRVGHNVLVYGKNKRAYKFLLFTHKPPAGEEDQFHLLSHNIDPEETLEPSYVRKRYGTSRQNDFEEPKKKFRIHDDDQHIIRRYKK